MIVSAAFFLLSLKSDLVETIEGDLPIVITAPHGGTSAIPGSEPRQNKSLPQFVTVLDARTDVLAKTTATEVEALFGKKPWVIVAKFARTYADANRPSEYGTESEPAKAQWTAYHAAVRKAVDAVRTKFGKGILVDIHGQGADTATVFRGTQNLKTVASLSDDTLFGTKSFLGTLEKSDVKVFPDTSHGHDKENPNFNGGYTVQTYGLNHSEGITAIQLEFGASYRKADAIPGVAKKLAVALKSHCDSSTR
jgi:N-formylglutamate amidohydrolase